MTHTLAILTCLRQRYWPRVAQTWDAGITRARTHLAHVFHWSTTKGALVARSLPSRDMEQPGFVSRIFGSLSPIQEIRQQGEIDRAEIDEGTKTELVRKKAHLLLTMADRKVQADINIQDVECALFEENETLRLTGLAHLQRLRDLEALTQQTGGELHPIDSAQVVADLNRIYGKNGKAK